MQRSAVESGESANRQAAAGAWGADDVRVAAGAGHDGGVPGGGWGAAADPALGVVGLDRGLTHAW